MWRVRLIAAAGALIAVVPGGVRAEVRIGEGLRAALAQPLPVEGLRVGVALAGPTPPPGAARRALVGARQQRVLDALPGGSFRIARRFEQIPGFAGFAQRAALEALLRRPDVAAVYLDGRLMPALAEGVPLVGADVLHAQGVTGQGIAVALIDTGIDATHPDLSDDLLHEQCFCAGHPSPQIGCCPNGKDSQSGPGAAPDTVGHGTAVAGIVTSAGLVAAPGVAPDAGIVAIKVDSGGGATLSDVDAGLDWVIANHAAFGIRVVNLSLADGGQYADPTALPCGGSNTAVAIRDLHDAGIAVFAGSGNNGYDAGISFPACVAQAISVGGVYDALVTTRLWCLDASCTQTCSDRPTGADVFVCHTNSGALLDLLAPDWATTTTAVGGGTIVFGGTSAASPYAAGQAALLLQADPSLAPDAIRSLLVGSGGLVVNPDSGLAFPRADVAVALATLRCGNGTLDAGEDCDDGGTAAGDCCDPDCHFEPAGSPCDDGSACTVDDACDGAGSCAGAALVCDDGNACTDDACDPAVGCTATANAAPCDDGNACTAGDLCSGGACLGGSSLDCDDGNACTADGCSALTGCFHSGVPGCVAVPVPALPLGPGAGLGALLALAGARGLRRARRRLG